MTAPLAWLILVRRAGENRIMAGRVFLSEQTAAAAAQRLTNRWQTCVAIPVYGAASP